MTTPIDNHILTLRYDGGMYLAAIAELADKAARTPTETPHDARILASHAKELSTLSRDLYAMASTLMNLIELNDR